MYYSKLFLIVTEWRHLWIVALNCVCHLLQYLCHLLQYLLLGWFGNFFLFHGRPVLHQYQALAWFNQESTKILCYLSNLLFLFVCFWSTSSDALGSHLSMLRGWSFMIHDKLFIKPCTISQPHFLPLLFLKLSSFTVRNNKCTLTLGTVSWLTWDCQRQWSQLLVGKNPPGGGTLTLWW